MVLAARYDCDLEKLGALADRFAPLAPDAETEAWLAEHAARPHGRLRSAALSALYHVMPLYDAHGLTGSYPMHLLSTGQLRALLGDGHGRLLDVGAGAGHVTRHAVPLCEQLVCTETSPRLAQRLRRLEYEVHVGDLGAQPLPLPAPFDAVLCLNVLDRTSHPLRLLAALRALCTPSARLLFSVPVPVSPAVFVAGGSVAPAESLPRRARGFEDAAVELTTKLFQARGFAVERLARAPYYSAGDHAQPLYVLDAALFVARLDTPGGES